jgi:uncharacterized damage-inducible protein DinB
MVDTTPRPLDWSEELAEQMDGHWRRQMRARLQGLSDAEYFWEPVPGCWSLRPRAESRTPMAAGAGAMLLDYAYPEPDPPPLTTIAWRLNHVLVAVLGRRNAAYFGGAEIDYQSFVYPETAADALAELDRQYARWIGGVRALTPAELATPVGDREPAYPQTPMAGLVLHIHREMIHHGAEIALLRDLYLREAPDEAG